MTRIMIAALTCSLVATSASLIAQGPPRAPQPSLTTSLVGRESYQSFCASCHGITGAGDGPVAAELRTPPADLTSLTRRNGGRYPRERVLADVAGTGRAPAAHGTTEMPVWGGIFRAFEADPVVRQRIQNVVDYLESLQSTATVSGDLGSRLFMRHCASCHGTSAFGDGPMADQLRRSPPDLTTFASRNGGVFLSERLRQIIDGRHVRSHGDPAMPVWGDAFQRVRDGLDAGPKERIDAIVDYLAGIQQRKS